MSSHSSVSGVVKSLLISSIAVATTAPIPVNAATVAPSRPGEVSSAMAKPSSVGQFEGMPQTNILLADRDDKKGNKDDKKGNKDDKKGNKDDRKGNKDDKKGNKGDRVASVDLNRAKNLARQAAEAANGGIRVYRAENAMHGPANLCPYVDNGDSWTFTFLGGKPGTALNTIESVVIVYKNTARVVVDYNGAVRSSRQSQVTSFTTSQRATLVSLLRGDCDCNYLLSDSIRTEIAGLRSLPPGIQKQLLRGKGLPPGIAKKFVRLPKPVNTYVKLPTQYDLLMIGSDLVLVDQVRSVVVDIISNVL